MIGEIIARKEGEPGNKATLLCCTVIMQLCSCVYTCSLNQSPKPDAVYWESYLTNTIVPEKSSLKVGRVRGELKMRKADPLHWSDFEV